MKTQTTTKPSAGIAVRTQVHVGVSKPQPPRPFNRDPYIDHFQPQLS